MQKTASPLDINSLFSVNGWVSLVTGGGTGTGLMAARGLAYNGSKCYITGRRKEVLERAAAIHNKLIKEAGGTGEIIPIVSDQSDMDQLKKLVAEIEAKEPCLHFLFLNAGITRPFVPFMHMEGDAEGISKAILEDTGKNWSEIWHNNVTSYYHAAGAFLPLLHKAADTIRPGFTASILTNSSVCGLITESQNGQFSYNVSKAGTVNLSKILATDFGKAGMKVRVNSVAIAYMPSEMLTGSSDEQGQSTVVNDGKFRKEKGILADRPGTEEDMLTGIFSMACNTYVTGQVLCIDGGFTCVFPSRP